MHIKHSDYLVNVQQLLLWLIEIHKFFSGITKKMLWPKFTIWKQNVIFIKEINECWSCVKHLTSLSLETKVNKWLLSKSLISWGLSRFVYSWTKWSQLVKSNKLSKFQISSRMLLWWSQVHPVVSRKTHWPIIGPLLPTLLI